MSIDPVTLTPGQILRTLFLYAEEKPSHLANHYLYCDRTLVYKWMRDTVILPKKHIREIVRFALEYTPSSQRKEIRGALDTPLSLSPLRVETKASLAGMEDFGEFLHEMLSQAIALKLVEQQGKKPQDGIVYSSVPRIKTGTRLIVFGLLSAAMGGMLWAVVNRLFGLKYYMGGTGNEPVGGFSILWGVLAGSPVILLALISMPKEEATEIAPRRKAALALTYSLLSGLGAYAFYNGGFRVVLESLGLAYGLQESIIAFVYAFILSAVPMLALPVSKIHIPFWFIPTGALLCSVAASVAALGTWLVGRPDPEVSQLRGFVVALILRLCMFAEVYVLLLDRARSFGAGVMRDRGKASGSR